MPKITKLRLHLLKLCRKNSGLFFPDTAWTKFLNTRCPYAVGACGLCASNIKGGALMNNEGHTRFVILTVNLHHRLL